MRDIYRHDIYMVDGIRLLTNKSCSRDFFFLGAAVFLPSGGVEVSDFLECRVSNYVAGGE